MAWNKTKYGNKKVKSNGVVFDSALEKYCHDLLTKFSVPFVWQVEWELQASFDSWEGKKKRRIYMRIDFVIKLPNLLIFIDTKGFATAEAKMKYKILEHQLQSQQRIDRYELHWLKNKKEVKDFIISRFANLKNK